MLNCPTLSCCDIIISVIEQINYTIKRTELAGSNKVRKRGLNLTARPANL